jgi:rare lipoprotein A
MMLAVSSLLGSIWAAEACAQSTDTPNASFNERFQGLKRTAPVFTYREVTSRLPPMPQPGEPDSSAQAGHSQPIESGRASWYQHSGRTASGERFNPDGLTAAHRSLPFGTRVLVVNKRNGRSVVVRITDRTSARMRAQRTRIVDLSRGSARAIGLEGVGPVALYEAR